MEARGLPFVMCLGLIGMVSIIGAQYRPNPDMLSAIPKSDSEIVFPFPAAGIREGKTKI